ncbi:MAG: hypothetical protein J3R72DRAFT_465201 [Linnemannia gamsii]|nr:MAG: hypothetical protein J3R72DRAFT_465201 [Linnemannia gamsii]
MGVKGLPAKIKEAKGQVPSVLQGPVHVDMNGSFYNPIKARSYSSLSRKTTSAAKSAAYNNPGNGQERPPAVQSTSPPPHQPSANIKAMVDAANENYFMKDKLAQVLDTASGPLKEESQDPKKMHVAHIATAIFKKLSTVCDPTAEDTVLHWDGRPSLQKAKEHTNRGAKVAKEWQVLQQTVEQGIVGGSRRKSAFRRCRNLYRPTQEVTDAIMEELERVHHCHICRCSFQSDTCIVNYCAEFPREDNIVVVSGDSDLICYRSVKQILYPVGKSKVYTLFDKADILQVLDLPTDNHLLLAAIVSGNDYTNGVKNIGLQRACDLIRGMDLPCHDVVSFQQYVSDFLDAVTLHNATSKSKSKVQKQRSKTTPLQVGVEEFKFAIQAFVEMREDPAPIINTRSTHDFVMDCLYDLEFHKTVQLHQHSAQTQSSEKQVSQQPIKDHKDIPQKRKRKRSRPKKSKKARKKAQKRHRKKKKWQSAKFRSRSDQHPRYVPHRVENPSLARPVEEEEVTKMAPSEPKPPRPSTSPTPTSASTAPASACKKPNKRRSSGGTRNLDVQPTPAMLKNSSKAAFKTTAQTVGSIQGCLRRGVGSRGVTDAEVNVIADRLEEALDVMNEAKRHVFRMVTMLVLDELTGQPPPQHNDDGPFDPLDLLLEKEIYLRYKEITPHLEPVNLSNLNLGHLIMDFGAETSLTMRQHFMKPPTTITDKMAKTGDTLSSSGAGESSSSTETPVEQNATLDEDEDDEDEDDGEAIGRFEDENGGYTICPCRFSVGQRLFPVPS